MKGVVGGEAKTKTMDTILPTGLVKVEILRALCVKDYELKIHVVWFNPSARWTGPGCWHLWII